MFSIAMLLHDIEYRKHFNSLTKEELADWVTKQLKDSGFPTYPCGISWGILGDRSTPHALESIMIIEANRPY